MQIVSVPLFDANMAVEACLLRYRKGNELFSTTQITNIFDGISHSDVLETLNYVGLDAFTIGKPIFVPVNSILLLNNLARQCDQPPEKVIFLLEDLPAPEALNEYLLKMDELRGMGYRFAATGISDLGRYAAVLQRCGFFLLPQNPERMEQSARVLDNLKRDYRAVTPVAENIQSAEIMQKLQGKGYGLFESRFFKVAVTAGDTNVSPLKMNSIRLLNMVQDEDFDFEQVAKIVQTDPALTISLLRMVNARAYRNSKIKSIAQAIALLGQKEVRKWVTTAVAQSLGSDRPNEITKISLVRAKFAENLAPVFEMAHMSQGLFLTGLFSALDVILEVPMAQAVEMVSLSDMIKNALVNQSGMFYPVLNMVTGYENADWVTVSRMMIVHDIPVKDLSNAYIDAMVWYKDIISYEADVPEADGKAADEKNR